MSQNSNVIKVVLLCLLLLGWGVIQSQMSVSNRVIEQLSVPVISVPEKIGSSHLAPCDAPFESTIQLAEVFRETALPQLLPDSKKANPIEQQPVSSQLLKKQQAAIDAGMPHATEEEKKIWLETLSDLSPDAIREMLHARNAVGPMMNSLKTEMPIISLPKLQQPNTKTKRLAETSTDSIVSQSDVTNRSQQTLQTGIVAMQQAEQVLLNNIVNASTMGFKRTSITLTDLPYDTIAIPAPFMEVGRANNSVETISLPIGFGVLTSHAEIDMSQGRLKKTGRSLDIAIQGKGLIQVSSGKSIYYTRNGHLTTNEEGELLILLAGKTFLIEPSITLPSDSIEAKISSTGSVTVVQPETSNEIILGQFQLAKFSVPSCLKQLGGGLYAATKAAGEPILATPETDDFGQLHQGYLECSNVNIKQETATLKQYCKQLQTLLELQRDLR